MFRDSKIIKLAYGSGVKVRIPKNVTLVLISVIFLGQLSAIKANALIQGDVCTQENQIKKSGKVSFKCIGTESLKYWIQLPSVIPLQKAVSKTISKWEMIAQSISFVPLVKQSDLEAANLDLEKTNTSASQVTQSLLNSRDIENNYKNTAMNLTASAQRYTALIIDKQKNFESKLREYNSASDKTIAYNSQYQAALSSRAATLSCIVLRDFGFVASCSNNAYQDALDTQVVRNYNSLKAASDAAYAAYTSALDDWRSTRRIESIELQKMELASATADLYSQRTSEWESLSKFVSTQQQYVQDFLEMTRSAGELQNELTQLPSQTFSAITALKAANKNNYSVKYRAAHSAVGYLQLAYKYYQVKKEETKEYLPLQISIQESKIWIPTNYYKGSTYSSIENTSGINFAWKWSTRSSCERTTSCTNLLIVTEKDCPRSVVVLDFMTDAKVSEVKTTSKEYSLKAGEISFIEVESKYSSTATAMYLREFKCISQ